MKKKMITLAILCILLMLCIIYLNTKQETIEVNLAIGMNIPNNKKIEWGLRRGKDHNQPTLDIENRKSLEKYNGIAMGNKEKKVVYLTFDNGYEAGYTEKILEVLKENNVKACFFLTGHYINSAQDLVKRMIEEGHIIGNHTINHDSMPELPDEKLKQEIMGLHNTVNDKFGYEMKYIRPPKGEYSERTLDTSKKLGYITVMWSFAYDDWEEAKQGRKDYGKTKILDNIHPGEIMLLHATSKDNSEILDDCIKEIKNMGYEFKRLDEFEP